MKILNEKYKYDFDTSSFNAIKEYLHYGFFTISACHADNIFTTNQIILDKQDQIDDGKLRKDLNELGLRFIEQMGKWEIGNQTYNEISYFVPYNDDYSYSEFMDIMYNLVNKYVQDCSLFCSPGDDRVYGYFPNQNPQVKYIGTNVKQFSLQDYVKIKNASILTYGWDKSSPNNIDIDEIRYIIESIGFRTLAHPYNTNILLEEQGYILIPKHISQKNKIIH